MPSVVATARGDGRRYDDASSMLIFHDAHASCCRHEPPKINALAGPLYTAWPSPHHLLNAGRCAFSTLMGHDASASTPQDMMMIIIIVAIYAGPSLHYYRSRFGMTIMATQFQLLLLAEEAERAEMIITRLMLPKDADIRHCEPSMPTGNALFEHRPARSIHGHIRCAVILYLMPIHFEIPRINMLISRDFRAFSFLLSSLGQYNIISEAPCHCIDDGALQFKKMSFIIRYAGLRARRHVKPPCRRIGHAIHEACVQQKRRRHAIRIDAL